MNELEKQVAQILSHGRVEQASREILDYALSRLPETHGVIVIEITGRDLSTLHRSCSLQRAIYELTMAKAVLVNERLGVESQYMVDGESGEEVDNG